MANKIIYKNFFALKELCQEVLHEYSEQIDGYPYDEEKLIASYNTDWYSSFEKEFNKNVINITDNVALQRYFNEIYYNGIVYFCIRFKILARYYEFKKRFKDRSELIKDDLFNTIYNHYFYSLSLLADTVRMKGIELNIPLKPHYPITIDDYISGRYMDLYSHPDKKEEPQPEGGVQLEKKLEFQSFFESSKRENTNVSQEEQKPKTIKQRLENKEKFGFEVGEVGRLTNRVLCLCYLYLKKVKKINDEIDNGSQYGKSFNISIKSHETAYNSFNEMSTTYKAPTGKELNKVIKALGDDFPEVKKCVQNDLDKLQ